MIAILSTNDSFIKHIAPLQREYVIIDDATQIDPICVLLIVENSTVIESEIFQKIDTLVLSAKPEFEEAMLYLQKGAKGYGNMYMSLVHISQAIETIANDTLWLLPSIMNRLISYGSQITQSSESQLLDSLSQREKDVAKEIQEGKSNKEIATSLGITERTVKAHLSHIYEKLDVHDRLALAMLLRG